MWQSASALLIPRLHYYLLFLGWLSYFYRPKRSFGQGNIFSSVCQEFCPQGGGACSKFSGGCLLQIFGGGPAPNFFGGGACSKFSQDKGTATYRKHPKTGFGPTARRYANNVPISNLSLVQSRNGVLLVSFGFLDYLTELYWKTVSGCANCDHVGVHITDK